MNDPKTHVDTHPSGHPNRTAVNAENPIFGRPADPIPAVSFQQAAVVQSDKHPRETVQSPLLSEADASPVLPSVAELGAMQAAGEEDAAIFETKQYADGSSATGVAPLPDQSPSEQAQDSSPSAEDLDAVAAETAAKEATAGATTEPEQSPVESDGSETPNVAEESPFAVGQKVRFTPDNGNDTTPIYTIASWSRDPVENADFFYKLEEMSGSLFFPSDLEAVKPGE